MKPRNPIPYFSAAFAAATMFLPLPSKADPMFGGHHDWSWGHAVFGSGMMILFWGGLILVVFLAGRWFVGSRDSSDLSEKPNKNALDLLAERYAKGEIDVTEYEERRARLQS